MSCRACWASVLRSGTVAEGKSVRSSACPFGKATFILSIELRHPQNLDDYSKHQPWISTSHFEPKPTKNTWLGLPGNPLLTVHMDDDIIICDIWVDVIQAPCWLPLQHLSVNHSVHGHTWLMDWYYDMHGKQTSNSTNFTKLNRRNVSGFLTSQKDSPRIDAGNPHATDLVNHLGKHMGQCQCYVHKRMQEMLKNVRIRGH